MSNSTSAGHAVGKRHKAVSLAASIVGATFLLVGVLGFVPGITTNAGDIDFAGHDSGTELLGIFHVSILHNLVHLAFGVVGLALARSARGARTFLVGGGVIYAIVWLYGVMIDQSSTANFLPVNTADNWLHAVLAVAMIALGVALTRGDVDTRNAGDVH